MRRRAYNPPPAPSLTTPEGLADPHAATSQPHGPVPGLPPAAARPPAVDAYAGELAAVVEWPAAWLVELPAAFTLLVEHRDSRRRFLVTTSRTRYTAARQAGDPVAHGDEWLALAKAAAEGRACLAVGQWLVPSFPPPARPEPPDWTLPPQPLMRALGGDGPSPGDGDWLPSSPATVAGVLEHFGLRALALDPPLEAMRGDLL